MTGAEATRSALALKKTPRLPVTLVGGASWYVHAEGKTFAEIKGDPEEIAGVFARAYRTFGHDFMWMGNNFINYPIHLLGCPIHDDSSDGPTLSTPVIDSLDKRDSLDMEKVFGDPLMQGIIKAHHIAADEVGELTFLAPTHWGPLTTAARIMGAENLMMATITDPEGLHDLLAFSTEFIWETAKRNMDHPSIYGVNYSDPVASGDMVSPETFRTFVKPYLKTLAERTHDAGKSVMIHICGDTTRILEDIIDIGPDGYSLEAKVDLKDAKSVLGGRVCVIGNVSPVGPFLNGGPEAVKAEAWQCIDAWGGDSGFILSLGCDFPKSAPRENLEALMSFKETALK